MKGYGLAVGVRCIHCDMYIQKTDKGTLFCECKKGDTNGKDEKM